MKPDFQDAQQLQLWALLASGQDLATFALRVLGPFPWLFVGLSVLLLMPYPLPKRGELGSIQTLPLITTAFWASVPFCAN